MSAIPQHITQQVLPSNMFTPVTFDTDNIDTAESIHNDTHSELYLFVTPNDVTTDILTDVDLKIPPYNSSLTQSQHIQCLTTEYCLYEHNAIEYNTIHILMPTDTESNNTLSYTKPIQRVFHIQRCVHSNTDYTVVPEPNRKFEPPAQPSRLDMPYKPFGSVQNTVFSDKQSTRNGVAHAQRTFEQNNGKINNNNDIDTAEPSSNKKQKKHKHEQIDEKSKSEKKLKKHKKQKSDG